MGLKKTKLKAQIIAFFHTQYSNIPSFHAAYQEGDRKKHCNSNGL